jgi:tetratricopeptide (TPR) repeat protein
MYREYKKLRWFRDSVLLCFAATTLAWATVPNRAHGGDPSLDAAGELAQQAEQAYRNHNYEAAATAYAQLVRTRPSKDNHLKLIRVLSSLGRQGEVVAAYQDMFRAVPSEQDAHISSFIRACRTAGTPATALSVAAAYLQSGTNATVCTELARLYASLGLLDQADAGFARAADLTKSAAAKARMLQEHARWLESAGRRERAAAVYRTAYQLADTPDVREWAIHGRIRMLRESSQLDAALQDLARAAQTPDARESLLLEWADSLTAAQRTTEAVRVFRRLATEQRRAEYYQRWIEALGRVGEHGKQIEACAEFVAAFPERGSTVRPVLMRALARSGQMNRAIEIGVEHAGKSATPETVWRELAGLCVEANMPAEAQKFFERAIAAATHERQRTAWRIEFARYLATARRFDDLMATLEKIPVNGRDPDLKVQMDQLAGAAESHRARQAFVDELMATSSRHATNAAAHREAAEALRFGRDFLPAADHYRRLIAVEPEADNYADLAHVLRAANRDDEALANYNLALRLQTDRRRRDYLVQQIAETYDKIGRAGEGADFVRTEMRNVENEYVKAGLRQRLLRWQPGVTP